MAAYQAQWANSSLRPSIFGVIDAYAGIPVILLAFDLDNALLAQTALGGAIALTILQYLGYTPQACGVALKRLWSRYLLGGKRTPSRPFELSIRRLMQF